MFERFRLTAFIGAMVRRLNNGSNVTDPKTEKFLSAYVPEFADGAKRYRNPISGAAVGLISSVVNASAEDGLFAKLKVDSPTTLKDLLDLYRMAEQMAKSNLVDCFPFFEKPNAALMKYLRRQN